MTRCDKSINAHFYHSSYYELTLINKLLWQRLDVRKQDDNIKCTLSWLARTTMILMMCNNMNKLSDNLKTYKRFTTFWVSKSICFRSDSLMLSYMKNLTQRRFRSSWSVFLNDFRFRSLNFCKELLSVTQWSWTLNDVLRLSCFCRVYRKWKKSERKKYYAVTLELENFVLCHTS